MDINSLIAEKIKELRESSFNGAGISQTELANKLNKAPNTISRWETGEYKPKIEDLYELSKFFKVSILNFFPPEADGIEGKSEIEEEKNEIELLFRSNKSLDDRDFAEIKNFVEFQIAKKQLLDASKKKSSGRKRKDAAGSQ
ncbi:MULTISPECIES: helix-turn-helix transcriptional regulator [Leptospira]|uniref:helix-turn-helix transcriptional regulator n=1 Tax=Leptospira TaxID=171 RepID=UPI00037A5BA3|nr:MULTISPECIES: helix-turn-helix transcriptional regulator [Leptospira]ULG76293.1 helix-turn-helix domain-containing protein [Leptospira interrogans]